MPLTDAAFLSIDSFVAGCAVAPLLCGASYRLAAAVLFGSADAAASFFGTLIAAAPHGLLVVAPGMPALYGVYLLAVSHLAGRGLRATGPERPPSRAGSGGMAWVILTSLAVALSVDNLVSGAPADGGWVAVAGCGSAAAMLLGLAVGGRVFHGLSATRRSGWIGVGLMITACSAVLS
jgi:hypothetical protein